MSVKGSLKQALGSLPYAPELYWQLRQAGRPLNKSFAMPRTRQRIQGWVQAVQAARLSGAAAAHLPRKIVLYTSLRYWTEHGALLALALAGQGHEVTLAFTPYPNWRKPLNPFDLRRWNAYVKHILAPAEGLIRVISLLDTPESTSLTAELQTAIREVSTRDVQYSLQVEEVDFESDLFKLRQERNTSAARAALTLLTDLRPDVLLTPNGSILEMGAVYATAMNLGIRTVTYEFGEQKGRIWMAQDAEVMIQDTSELWQARRGEPLSESQQQQIRDLFASRRGAGLWENFTRRWQGVASQGGEKARADLGLDQRPLAVLAANVIGDSLTLGRQVFSSTMTEWLERTVQWFAARPHLQLVVRVHPGERYTKGPSVAEAVHKALPGLGRDPAVAHIHLVAFDAPVNTYDLVEIADLGLVYTTTTGMEMAMSGLATLAAGRTHYRARGFTLDPATWDEYFALLEQALSDPLSVRPTHEQTDLAWNYAYRFFFEYPFAFPYHLLHFWNELDEWPLERTLLAEGLAQFGAAFAYLTGEPRRWEALLPAGSLSAAELQPQRMDAA
jgi:hypothetical protein